MGTGGSGGDDLVQGLREAEAYPEDYLRGEPVGRAQGEVGESGTSRGDHAAGGDPWRGEGGVGGDEEPDTPPHPGEAHVAVPAGRLAREDRDLEAVGGSGRAHYGGTRGATATQVAAVAQEG